MIFVSEADSSPSHAVVSHIGGMSPGSGGAKVKVAHADGFELELFSEINTLDRRYNVLYIKKRKRT